MNTVHIGNPSLLLCDGTFLCWQLQCSYNLSEGRIFFLGGEKLNLHLLRYHCPMSKCLDTKCLDTRCRNAKKSQWNGLNFRLHSTQYSVRCFQIPKCSIPLSDDDSCDDSEFSHCSVWSKRSNTSAPSLKLSRSDKGGSVDFGLAAALWMPAFVIHF